MQGPPPVQAARLSELAASCTQLKSNAWSALLAQFGDANVYQTYAYGSVSWGERNLRHVVVRDGDRVRAIAQVRGGGLGRCLGVAYVRWGPCGQRRDEAWDGPAFRKALETLADEFVRSRRYVLRIVPPLFSEDPEAQHARQILHELGFQNNKPKSTYRTLRIDLTVPLEDLRKRLDPKWRNQLNAANRNHLEITIGEDAERFAQFLTLYDEMMARKRFETTVNPRQFAQMQEVLNNQEKMQVGLARGNGRLHAGVVVSGIGQTRIYLLGATGAEGLKSKASYLLHWRMMQHIRSTGCRFYDLGGINPEGNPGVYHFKVGMGGVEVRQLGRFELGPGKGRLELLHWAERFHRLYRTWRSRTT